MDETENETAQETPQAEEKTDPTSSDEALRNLDIGDKKEDEEESTEQEEPKAEESVEEPVKEEPQAEAKKPDPEFDIRLPDNSPLTVDDRDQLVAFAKEHKMNKDQAQAILDRESNAVNEFAVAQKEMVVEKAELWKQEVIADKELGGEKFNENISLAQTVIKTYGTENLKGLLDVSGLGNHPEVVRLFSRIGRTMSQDQLVNATVGPSVPKSVSEMFYGDTQGKTQ